MLAQAEIDMEPYRHHLIEMSTWFRSVSARYAGEMKCANGCILCCHGLFDIPLPDALEVAEALAALPEFQRKDIISRAGEVQGRIARSAPTFEPPYLLGPADEAWIDSIAGENADARCPFLSNRDSCRIYENRPMACRLEGLPMVALQDGLFGDWCELNFPGGVTADVARDLRRDYYRLQEIERSATREASQRIWGTPDEQVTVLIPSLIVEFARFWDPILVKIKKQ